MSKTTLCPSCNRKIPAFTTICKHCGQSLHSMRLANPKTKSDRYEIIPEGEQFAIAFRGDVKVHGLSADELVKAQEVLAILNSVVDDVGEGC